MADQRMKGVAEDDESVDGDEDVVVQQGGEVDRDVEVYDELELGLSIGRGTTGPETAGRDFPRELRPWWGTDVGSSSSYEMAREGIVLREVNWGDDLEVVPSAAEMGNVFFCEGQFPEIERLNEDRARDSQHKRAKLVTMMEVASSSGADSTAEPTALPHPPSAFSDSEMTLFFSLFSSSESLKHKESTDESSTKSSEDTEVRMDFSDDLLHLILSFLSQKDLCRAGVTCKQWLAASTHADFWKFLKFENIGISNQNFTAICRRYPNATEVNMSGVPDSDVLVMEAMSSLRRLQTLFLDKGQFGDAFFQALTDCHELTNLKISDAYLGNGIQEVAIYHERLQILHIAKCRVLRISVRCPQLHILSLKRTNMGQAVLNCPQLHELDFSSCHKMSDIAIRSAAMSCPTLGTLNISSCSCVSDETIREISDACPNLSVLDASYCPNISLETSALRMLVDLKLQSCEGINSASMSAIAANSRMLEALQLDNCGLLTSITLDLPHLQNLSLVHLRKFVELNLQSPMLQHIKVSRCSALQRISIMSNALQKLILQKQESLATLSLQCYNLHEVDLSDCESLTNSVCEVFNDGGGCPMLRSLVLDNCECLSMVGIKSSSLANLSLAGCRAMTSLELSCPNLQKVNLDGCDHLEKALFCPVGIESLNLGICPKLNVLHIEAPKMSILELKGCGVLSEAYIRCPNLTSLDASFCRQLLDESLSTTATSCPHIESLILSSCLSIGVSGLSSLKWLRRLSLLDLSYTFLMDLQPVFDTCTQLVILKLSACKYLTDSSLDALCKVGALPALRELDLSYSSIGQSSISELFAYCTNLVHVNLNGCANMHELVWGSNKCDSSDIIIDPNSVSAFSEKEGLRKSERLLEILNCTGSPNIKRVVIHPAAYCFHLSKINLNLSANLKEVDLTCANLGTLNLSYCCSLEILKLDCPKLNNLQLMACTMLEEEELAAAISHCSMLEILNIHSCPKLYVEDYDKIRAICPSLKRIHCSL